MGNFVQIPELSYLQYTGRANSHARPSGESQNSTVQGRGPAGDKSKVALGEAPPDVILRTCWSPHVGRTGRRVRDTEQQSSLGVTQSARTLFPRRTSKPSSLPFHSPRDTVADVRTALCLWNILLRPGFSLNQPRVWPAHVNSWDTLSCHGEIREKCKRNERKSSNWRRWGSNKYVCFFFQ